MRKGEGRKGRKWGKWKEQKGKGKKYIELCLENKANIPYQKLNRLKWISIQFYILIKIDINLKNSDYIIIFSWQIVLSVLSTKCDGTRNLSSIMRLSIREGRHGQQVPIKGLILNFQADKKRRIFSEIRGGFRGQTRAIRQIISFRLSRNLFIHCSFYHTTGAGQFFIFCQLCFK